MVDGRVYDGVCPVVVADPQRTENEMAWTPFDYDHKDANPLPAAGSWVWVHDESYHGVTLGTWDSGGWWVTIVSGDDCSISHWMPLDRPARPAGLPLRE